MSQVKKIRRTPEERAAQYEKMQQFITERCEREVREQDYEWMMQHLRERKAGIKDDDDDEEDEDDE